MLCLLGKTSVVAKALHLHLIKEGFDVNQYGHNEISQLPKKIDTLIYSLGTSGGAFRENLDNCFSSHTETLYQVIIHSDIKRIIFLSSIHLYMRVSGPIIKTIEDIEFTLNPHKLEHFYDLCKLMSEAILISKKDAINVNILRLGHVVGDIPQKKTLLGYMASKNNNREFNFTVAKSSGTYFISQELINMAVVKILKNKSISGIHNVISTKKVKYEYLGTLLEKLGVKVTFDEKIKNLENQMSQIKFSKRLIEGEIEDLHEATLNKIKSILCISQDLKY